MTYTYAILHVSRATFNDIQRRLTAVGSEAHRNNDGILDMHGIALAEEVEVQATHTRFDAIISWLEEHKHETFELARLQKDVPGRRATLYTILHRLRTMGLVNRTDKAFARKLWWTTETWRATNVQRVKERYEDYMLVRRTSKGELK